MTVKSWQWLLSGALGMAGLAAIAGAYADRNARWVVSQNAVIEVPTGIIALPAGGLLRVWRVPVGGRVQVGETLGQAIPLGGGLPQPIRSPVSGTLLTRFAPVFSTLPPGSTLAVTGDLGQESLLAMVDETAVRRIAPGDPATVRFSAYPGRTFPGRVVQVGSAVASATSDLLTATGTFSKVTMWVPVVLSFQRQNARLFPGFTASVAIRIH